MTKPVRLLFVLALALLFAPIAARAEMDLDTAASHFGQRPAVWSMRMSPDGQKVSLLRMHPEGLPIAMVIDLRTGKGGLILASDVDKEMDLVECDWATNERLLCWYYGIQPYLGDYYVSTRVVAVNEDGSNQQVLAQRQQKGEQVSRLGGLVDWLPDDPKHVLMPIAKDFGQGVSRVNIEKNKTKTLVKPKRSVWGFWSDGRGNPRVRIDYDRTHRDLQYRLAGENKWRLLHRSDPDDLEDGYWPIGFGDEPNDLYVYDLHDGRQSIFVETLGKDGKTRELVYSHPEVDVDGFLELGKYRRPIGVTWSTERPEAYYFDEAVRGVDARIREALPSANLFFLSESWDRRFYLVRASSDVDGGRYYRFDSETGELSLITTQHPWLEGEPLAPMKPISYPSDDGREIPGYLTMTADGKKGPRPGIILPHGGPAARDDWGYDFLAQYLAAQGYAVLQPNYRGSWGYGVEWMGEGAFRDWKRVVTDIEYGARYLVEQGIVDPDRICAVGWSYGGYAALISAAEHPERYRCVVSIAGVTDPVSLVDDADGLERRFLKALIGREPEVVRLGSPEKRAEDIVAPVLLVHAEKDVNVPFDHSEDMKKALEKHDRSVVFVEYEDDDHHMRKQANRIDMLQKVGDFLDEHLRARPREQARAEP